jgi:hypothetical protein
MHEILHKLTCPHCWAMALMAIPFLGAGIRYIKERLNGRVDETSAGGAEKSSAE